MSEAPDERRKRILNEYRAAEERRKKALAKNPGCWTLMLAIMIVVMILGCAV